DSTTAAAKLQVQVGSGPHQAAIDGVKESLPQIFRLADEAYPRDLRSDFGNQPLPAAWSTREIVRWSFCHVAVRCSPEPTTAQSDNLRREKRRSTSAARFPVEPLRNNRKRAWPSVRGGRNHEFPGPVKRVSREESLLQGVLSGRDASLTSQERRFKILVRSDSA